MSGSTLCLHRGAREVTVEELKAVQVPKPQGRWHPLGHFNILSMVRERLDEAGFKVSRERHALSREGSRYFGTIDLTAKVSDEAGGITLCCGVINSVDASLSARLAMGSRVFCCDNLTLAGSVKIAAKHTK